MLDQYVEPNKIKVISEGGVNTCRCVYGTVFNLGVSKESAPFVMLLINFI